MCLIQINTTTLQNPHSASYLTSGMLLHYLWKLKIKIFCRYSADMEENANKLHFIASHFVIHSRSLIFSVFKIASFPHIECK